MAVAGQASGARPPGPNDNGQDGSKKKRRALLLLLLLIAIAGSIVAAVVYTRHGSKTSDSHHGSVPKKPNQPVGRSSSSESLQA